MTLLNEGVRKEIKLKVEPIPLEGLAPRVAMRIKWLEGRAKFWRVAAIWALAATIVVIIAGVLFVRTVARTWSEAGVSAGQQTGAMMGYGIGYKDAREGRPPVFDRVLERATEMIRVTEQQRADKAGK